MSVSSKFSNLFKIALIFINPFFSTIKKLFNLLLCFYPQVSQVHHLHQHQVGKICYVSMFSMSVLDQILNCIQTCIELHWFLSILFFFTIKNLFTLLLCFYPHIYKLYHLHQHQVGKIFYVSIFSMSVLEQILNCVQTYIGLHWFLSILFFFILFVVEFYRESLEWRIT